MNDPPAPEHNPYSSGMVREFAWHQRLLLHPALRAISRSGTPLTQLAELARSHTLIYVLPHLAAWEYLACNLCCLDHQLPLAVYAPELSTRSWHPWRAQGAALLARLRNLPGLRTPLPDPIRTGWLRTTVASGQSVALRLKTTELFDDRYWDTPSDDPLAAILHGHQDGIRPAALIPLQFLWSPRPDHSERQLLDILLGDRTHPGRIRKILLLLRNFRRVNIHIGPPIDLRAFVAAQPEADHAGLVAQLRAALLTQFTQQRKSFNGPALKPRRWMIDQLQASPRVQRACYDTTRTRTGTIQELQHLVRRYAIEIAADVNYTMVEVMTWLLHHLFRTIYDGISTDLPHLLATIRAALEKGPVVLVPNHRSHADYLILSHLLYKHGVALPYVAAGKNLSFWPLGHLFRWCGAFFLRRSFSGNLLYRTVFAEYLRLLIADGHCLEFFIEGGRSRTGKLLLPRHGMLTMLAEAMDDQAGGDLTFIPVAVTYDQVMEQGSYLSEIQGSHKQRESIWDIFRLGRYLRRHYGKIYLQVGTPLSYAAVRASLPAAPAAEDKRALTGELATRIMREINRQTIVTPVAVVATALLARRDRATTAPELTANCERLVHYLRWRHAPFSDSLRAQSGAACAHALERLRAQRLLTIADQYQPGCYIVDAGKRSTLDLSKNTLIHFFATASCVAVSLRAAFLAGAAEWPLPALLEEVELCQTLFAFEFRFAARVDRETHVQHVLRYYEEQGWLTAGPESVLLHMQGAHHLRLFAVLMRNYFESYKAVFLAIRELPQPAMAEKELLKHCVQYARHLLLLGQIRSPEAISQFNFRNALLAYGAMGILHRETLEKDDSAPLYHWVSTHPQLLTIQQKLEQWC